MRITPLADNVTVVLVGRFNPAIFHPMWFAINGLIGKKDAENAEVAVTHPEISQFRAGEITVLVETEKFSANCISAHHGLVKDLVLGAFGQCLNHTPVTAIGINRLIHFDCGSFEVREKLGNILAPKEPWGEWGSQMVGEPGMTAGHGGMDRLSMVQRRRPDRHSGHIQAEIRPSSIAIVNGVSMSVNDHYQLEKEHAAGGCGKMLEVVEDRWEWSLSNSAFIFDQIMGLAERLQRGVDK